MEFEPSDLMKLRLGPTRNCSLKFFGCFPVALVMFLDCFHATECREKLETCDEVWSGEDCSPNDLLSQVCFKHCSLVRGIQQCLETLPVRLSGDIIKSIKANAFPFGQCDTMADHLGFLSPRKSLGSICSCSFCSDVLPALVTWQRQKTAIIP